jgi:hypothetical protein
MSGRDQLIEYIVRDIVGYHMEDRQLNMSAAMDQFYSSEIFDKLHDTSTGLYLCGSAYVYDLFKDELDYGRIVQLEI